jgi:hypothetical protein
MTTARDFILAVRQAQNPRSIKLRWSGEPVQHDETVSEYEMRRDCRNFFSTPHGKRETITVYRGFLIVRNTRQFTGCRPERCTQLYIYLRSLEGSPDMLHVDGAGNSVKSAQRRVDRILACGCIDESQAEPVLPAEPAQKIDLTL